MVKKCLLVLYFGLMGCRLSAQVSVSRLAPAGLASRQLLVSLDSLFAGKSYGAVAGVKAFINCGKGDDAYFGVLTGLTGINRENFEEKVRGLLGD
jgi:hypothetical protein